MNHIHLKFNYIMNEEIKKCIKEYIKDNLQIVVSSNNSRIKVLIYLEGEKIAEDYLLF